jgi:hypothetical protein
MMFGLYYLPIPLFAVVVMDGWMKGATEWINMICYPSCSCSRLIFRLVVIDSQNATKPNQTKSTGPGESPREAQQLDHKPWRDIVLVVVLLFNSSSSSNYYYYYYYYYYCYCY